MKGLARQRTLMTGSCYLNTLSVLIRKKNNRHPNYYRKSIPDGRHSITYADNALSSSSFITFFAHSFQVYPPVRGQTNRHQKHRSLSIGFQELLVVYALGVDSFSLPDARLPSHRIVSRRLSICLRVDKRPDQYRRL